MFERFVHAGAVLALGDVAAGIAHRRFDFFNRVCRTCRHGSDLAVEHRDVVVMVASGENVFARNVDQPRELGQRCAFVIIGMAKPEINSVALIIELRLLRARPFDEFNDAVHFFVTICPQAFQPLRVINQLGFGFLGHEIDDFGQN